VPSPDSLGAGCATRPGGRFTACGVGPQYLRGAVGRTMEASLPRLANPGLPSIRDVAVLVALFVAVVAARPEVLAADPLFASGEPGMAVAGRAAEDLSSSWQREAMLSLAKGRLPFVRPGPPTWHPRNEGVPADGRWSAFPPPLGRFGHTAIYDPLHNRMLVFGGVDGYNDYRNDVWELSLDGMSSWRQLRPSGMVPVARLGHSAIYDPRGQRMLIFGGTSSSYAVLNDVWALSLSGAPEWIEVAPSGAPPPGRYGHSAIYDSRSRRMVVFGGSARGSLLNDVWALSLTAEPVWQRIDAAGDGPGGRQGQTAIYDPRGKRMVVFGGMDYSRESFLRDAWALSLHGRETWSRLDPAGDVPPGRYQHSAICDPLEDRMVIFGGGVWLHSTDGSTRVDFNDTWTLSLTGTPTWDNPRPSGDPPVRSYHSAVYDPRHGRMLVFGGGQTLNDVWALSLAGPLAWQNAVPAPRPSASYLHAAVYDLVRGRMLTFGGVRSDVWSLSLTDPSGWSRAVSVASPGGRRDGLSAIHDPPRDRVLIFGGQSAFGSPTNDVWELSLAGTPEWTILSPMGQPPRARSEHTAIYDPVRDRMLVLGGETDFGCAHTRNDVWALSLSGVPTWTELQPQGAPPPRRTDATAVYDPVRDRVVLFGGQCSSDLWALSLAGTPRWDAVAAAGPSPGERFWHSAVYDSRRDRMVVFGGYPGVNDVWELSLAGTPTWSRLQPAGPLPGGRYGHVAIYDEARDRMVLQGGNPVPDAWSLTWGDGCQSVSIEIDSGGESARDGCAVRAVILSSSAFSACSVVPATVTLAGTHGEPERGGMPMSWLADVNRDGLEDLVICLDRGTLRLSRSDTSAALEALTRDGGRICGRGPIRLERGSDDSRTSEGLQSAAEALGPWLGLAAPDPMRETTDIPFRLAQRGHTSLTLFDAAGRRVRSIVSSEFPAGEHSARWDGRDGAGRRVHAGLYFYRLVAGGQTLRRTVVVVP